VSGRTCNNLTSWNRKTHWLNSSTVKKQTMSCTRLTTWARNHPFKLGSSRRTQKRDISRLAARVMCRVRQRLCLQNKMKPECISGQVAQAEGKDREVVTAGTDRDCRTTDRRQSSALDQKSIQMRCRSTGKVRCWALCSWTRQGESQLSGRNWKNKLRTLYVMAKNTLIILRLKEVWTRYQKVSAKFH
jgi:hypothetical protein